jgi:aminopeptidase
MGDPRIRQMARVLIDHSIRVQQNEQVLIQSTPLAMPLVEELYRLILERGGHPVPFITSERLQRIFYETASEEQLDTIPGIIRDAYMKADALISIDAPENRRELMLVDPKRLQRHRKAKAPLTHRYMRNKAKWVVSLFPTASLAQDADMPLSQYEDFVFAAINLDWKRMKATMETAKALFDEAREVRIEAPGTNLVIGLEGRHGMVDGGENNMPGGEFFYSPVEHQTEGTVTFEWPQVYNGREVSGIRLVFRDGKVTEAKADKGEDFLHEVLETDEGARYLGELGIGCNTVITRYTKNTLFDEKIGGTIHLAIGQAFEELGGKNRSAVHWDLVKDLRNGGRIYLDGRLVQENGVWCFQ